jgi:cation diffusion facilitator family transporter
MTANRAPQNASAAKRSAALGSLAAAGAITLLKLITGLASGSLGMLSEAAHSGIDLIASAATLVAVRAADQPADESHNYGHGKLENLSAAFEILLMAGSCYWIAWEAIHRIRHPAHLALTFSVWPFVVLVCSIAVDATRSRALHRAARAHRSDALEADAVHFGTDIWSAAAVLIGLAATYAGQHFHRPALFYADPIAALIVAAIILSVTWRLARRTIDSLTDATPTEVREQRHRQIVHDLQAIPDVVAVERLRVRRSGPNYFVDLTLGLPRNLTFQRSEQVTSAATEAVQQRLENADVVIHTVPTATLAESVFDRIRAVAARMNLSIHDVTVTQMPDSIPGAVCLHVEQHLEVPESIPLREAHDIATALENNIRVEIPQVGSLLTHIESEPSTIDSAAPIPIAAALEKNLISVAHEFPEILDVHDILVTRAHGGAAHGLQIACHCTLPDDLPMNRVHAVITDFEAAFRHDHPDITRVFIHPEPATDNRR